MTGSVPTKFPAGDLPSPQETTTGRGFGDGHVGEPVQVQLNRWFCCCCARDGHASITGQLHDEHLGAMVNTCVRDNCGHTQCHNCGLGPDHKSAHIVRTAGGLHASPRFIDPVRWECLCGEWQRNLFDGQSVSNQTGCASPDCGWPAHVAVLHAGSTVLNKYGQRLGSADQATMITGGPWFWQRLALADPRSALVPLLRQVPFRSKSALRTCRTTLQVWAAGERAPSYPKRPEPPTRDPDCPQKHHEYELGYLNGIPWEPLERDDSSKNEDNDNVDDFDFSA